MEIAEFSKQGAGTTGCRIIDPQLVQQMCSIVHKKTRQELMDQFGVSYNTWRKLIAGMPVRTSLAERLEARLRHLEQQQDCHTAMRA